MDEASSKYVDQIATQRLINDKLKLVHHSPDHSMASIDTSFRDFKDISLQPDDVIETQNEKYTEISFQSSIDTRLPSVSGRLKPGATVPNGSIVDAVLAIMYPLS